MERNKNDNLLFILRTLPEGLPTYHRYDRTAEHDADTAQPSSDELGISHVTGCRITETTCEKRSRNHFPERAVRMR